MEHYGLCYGQHAAREATPKSTGLGTHPPPLRVTTHGEVVNIEVSQMGEYVSTVNRLQLRDEQAVVWEIHAETDVAQFGVMTLTAVAATAEAADMEHFGQLSQVLAELKAHVKGMAGSNYFKDRRRDHGWS